MHGWGTGKNTGNKNEKVETGNGFDTFPSKVGAINA